MNNQKQKCARNRQVHERTALKHSNLTTYVGVIAMFMTMWFLGTYGIGHLFGVI